ncbi:MAG: hypothetical protein HW400_399 [Candidatus Levybacteria bacterium]|nr:hypothetical protein [Candidatus Levybacteria bacterium]
MIDKKNILGVGITNATKKEILEYIVKNVENFQKKLYFVTPNPEFLVLASKNYSFRSILNKADLASADGIGVILAGKILGKPLKERFTGVDLVKSVCEEVAEKPITVGFLGGGGGVAEKTVECLLKKHPKLKVAFVGEEWPDCGLDRNGKKIDAGSLKLEKITSSNSPTSNFSALASSFHGLSSKGIDILFVAFGAPKQEFWISENLEKIPVKIAIGVGGAFDYISGKTPRAPGFIRSIGLEWLFRLILQPRRIKRQLALIEFIWLVAKEKLSNKN